MRPLSVSSIAVAALLTGCAFAGFETHRSGAICKRPQSDHTHESDGNIGDFAYQSRSRSSGSLGAELPDETRQEYEARIKCVREAQLVSFNGCNRYGNGIISEWEWMHQAREAAARCGEEWHIFDAR